MEDKCAPQEGPREGAAPASPGAGPNSPLQLRTTTDERCVVVASQTQSLALVARLCVREGWPWCLLDGRTPSKERQKLADGFNDPARRDPGGHQFRSDVVPATASARWRKG